MRRRRRLSTQILASQLAVLVVSLTVGYGLYVPALRRSIDREFERQALTVAKAAAAMPEIRAAMAAGDPHHEVASLAESFRRATGAAYVVVIDLNKVRHSHPNPALIGKKVSEPLVALDGRGHVGIDNGSLGRSANGKAPLRAPDGRIIGEVSAGILERRVSAQLLRDLPTLVTYMALALGLGLIASVLLTRRLKRQTFGLELDEMASLLQEREAMLHGIREGVVVTNRAGVITLVNDEARRLLELPDDAVGRQLADVVALPRLRDLLTSAGNADAEPVVLTDGATLLVSRMEVGHRGVPLGSVVTVRDRTELTELLRELDSIRSLTDALRAQQHEHANRIHTLAGLLSLGKFDEAMQYSHEVDYASTTFAESLRDNLADPAVAALLIAKRTIAAERGVTLTVTGEAALNDVNVPSRVILSVLGNLVDNAIDAASGTTQASVEVRVAATSDGDVLLEVADSGSGVPAGTPVFEDGFSTKPARMPGVRRGLGLALVRRFVTQCGGDIDVHNESGAVFTVRLPSRASAVSAAEDAVLEPAHRWPGAQR